MRCLILAPAASSNDLMTILAQNIGQRLAASPDAGQDAQAKTAEESVSTLIYENQGTEEIQAAASGSAYKILLLRDPRELFVQQLQNMVMQFPDHLRNELFLGDLLDIFKAKQANPNKVELTAIARLFALPEADAITQQIMEYLRRFARLVSQLEHDWHVFYFDDLRSGNFRGLSRYLGCQIGSSEELAAQLEQEINWRDWFHPNDVATLRPVLTDILSHLGYFDSWQLHAEPKITPEQSWKYVAQLIAAQAPPEPLPVVASSTAETAIQPTPDQQKPEPEPVAAAPKPAEALVPLAGTAPAQPACCNICGGNTFSGGPNGRMSETGMPPHCTQCGSLERQRIVRRLFQALPLGFLDWRRGLQFSPDPGVCAKQLRSYEVSVYGGENSLDMQDIARADGSYDFVSFNHVLEFVRDDLRGFAEMARVLSANGFIQACFSSPLSRPICIDYAAPFGPHETWHLYGLDMAERFQCEQKGLTMFAVEETDPCTGAREIVHFFCKNKTDASRMQNWFRQWSESIRVLA